MRLVSQNAHTLSQHLRLLGHEALLPPRRALERVFEHVLEQSFASL